MGVEPTPDGNAIRDYIHVTDLATAHVQALDKLRAGSENLFLNLGTGSGHSVVVIEHNLDVIKTADWIIDLGPEGGDKGGEIVAEGVPEFVAKSKGSYTGEFLKKMI